MATHVLASHPLPRFPVITLGAVLVLSAGFVLVSSNHIVMEIAGLYPRALPANPYFVPSHAGLLYVVTPLLLLLSFALFLAPGLLLTIAIDRPLGICDWLLRGFAASFLLFAGSFTLHKNLSHLHLERGYFGWILGLLTLGALAVAAWRIWSGQHLSRALRGTWDWRRIGWVVFLPWLAVVLLLPLIFWQDFNADGVEAFLLGHRLHAAASPGPVSLSAGMVASSVLVNWFETLFEAPEPSARLPVFFLLPLLFAGIVALSETRTGSRLSFAQEGILALGVAGFLIAIGLNASYEPYFADLAAPGSNEFLLAYAVIAMLYFFWQRGYVWFFVYALIALWTRPTPVFLLGLLVLAVWFFYRRGRLRLVRRAIAALAACLLLAGLWELWNGAGSVPASASGLMVIAQRMRYVSWDDWQNFLYLAIPCGLAPLLAFGFVRRHGRINRCLIFVTLCFFAAFYLKAFVNMHHFAPVMLLPVAVFGRLLATGQLAPRKSLALVYCLMLLVLWASLPRIFAVNRGARELGQRVSCRLRECATVDLRPDRHLVLLETLFPPQWDVKDSSSERVVSSVILAFYSGPSQPQPDTTYLLQPAHDPLPSGFETVATNRGAAVLVRDRGVWASDRFGAFRTDFRSPLYAAPDERMFPFVGVPAKEYDLDLADFVRWFRDRHRQSLQQP